MPSTGFSIKLPANVFLVSAGIDYGKILCAKLLHDALFCRSPGFLHSSLEFGLPEVR